MTLLSGDAKPHSENEVSSRLSRPAEGPKRSEVEGSAVRPSALPNSPYQNLNPKQKCHPDRSVAKWRDLLLLLRA